MPTSLSLQDLRKGRLLQQPQQLRSYASASGEGDLQQNRYFLQQQPVFDGHFDDEFVVEENVIVEDFVEEEHGQQQEEEEEDHTTIKHNPIDVEGGGVEIIQQMHNIQPIDRYGLDIGSEQVVVESSGSGIVIDHGGGGGGFTQTARIGRRRHAAVEREHGASAQHKRRDIQKRQQRVSEEAEQHVNVDGDDDDEEEEPDSDLPIFKHSRMGVYEFSTEFLAFARKHRLQPKVKAVLFDLLQKVMPPENRCPPTVTEMRKMVARDVRPLWFGTTQGACLPSSSKVIAAPPTQKPKGQSFMFATNVSSNSQSFKLPSRHQPSFTSGQRPYELVEYQQEVTNAIPGQNYQLGEEEFVEEEVVDGGGNQFVYYPQQGEAELPPELQYYMPQIYQTINRLSEEVLFLRSQLQSQQQQPSSSSGSYGTVRKLKKRVHDTRFGIHIFDDNEQRVLISALSSEKLQRTVEISRNDENRLIYGNNDITELVLDKIDLTPYIHNPSLCGRMVADVLFSPEYLADKHILGEGQLSSRTRLETLPPEMTQLFYDSLRKLGVSRIDEEDQEHWLYLARDGVNQRARDLKANRKRKFYIDEQPVFREEEY